MKFNFLTVCEIFIKLKFSKSIQNIRTLENFGRFLLIPSTWDISLWCTHAWKYALSRPEEWSKIVIGMQKLGNEKKSLSYLKASSQISAPSLDPDFNPKWCLRFDLKFISQVQRSSKSSSKIKFKKQVKKSS